MPDAHLRDDYQPKATSGSIELIEVSIRSRFGAKEIKCRQAAMDGWFSTKVLHYVIKLDGNAC